MEQKVRRKIFIRRRSDFELLEDYLKHLQKEYKSNLEKLEDIGAEDYEPVAPFIPEPDVGAELCADIADKFGFEGSLFRELIPTTDRRIQARLQILEKRIKALPHIMKVVLEAELDAEDAELGKKQGDSKKEDKKESTGKTIPADQKLLRVADLALVLNIGESTLRRYNRLGLIPKPSKSSGTLFWSRSEIDRWIEAGRPLRERWEMRNERGEYGKAS